MSGVKIGLRNLTYKLLKTDDATGVTYETPKKIPGLISATLTPQSSEGELYADDVLSEYNSSITAVDITIATKDIPLEDRAVLLGYDIDSSGRMRVSSNATAPFAGLTWESERSDGTYQLMQVHKVRFAPIEEAYETKGGSITYQTVSITGKSLALDSFDAFYDTKIVDRADLETEAENWHKATTLTALTPAP